MALPPGRPKVGPAPPPGAANEVSVGVHFDNRFIMK